VEPIKKHRKTLTEQDKIAMHTFYMAGYKYREIAHHLNIGLATVNRWMKRILEEQTFQIKPRSGRPRKTSQRTDRMILRKVVSNRFKSLRELQNDFAPLGVSMMTISRRIREDGRFKSYWATKKPFINETNRARRLAWCRERVDWPVERWFKFLWSDESPFVLRYHGKKRVWRLHNERYNPMTTVATVKHDKKIMVWGCFAHHGVGKLYRVTGTMDGKAYKQIIRSELLPSAYTLFPDDNYIFQQDNDPKHTSTIVRDYMDEIGLVRTAWPAQSPDLNPIENLWSIIDQATQFRAADTEEELFEILNEAWQQIPIELLNRLVESMPLRCQAVLDADGFATRY
jgi:transposase